jgi:hypothetical protein
MEISCTRCHQTVQDGDCFCPACGLPQLTYAADGSSGPAPSEPGVEVVRDAGSIDWRAAIRVALLMGVPAGMLCSNPSPLSGFGLMWMAVAAAWAVVLYVRQQRPAWITAGAGARIGMVTGIMASWLAFAISGGALFVQRYLLHQSSQMDSLFAKTFVEAFQQRTQQSLASMGTVDAAQAQTVFSKMIAGIQSPEGHAWIWASSIAFYSFFMLFFALGGGAVGARLVARNRRPEI